MPEATVVIPARDEAGRIGDTVRGVLAAAPAGVEIEVLVVDDGSSDATAAVAAAAGARVLPVPPARAGNPAAARNLGARHAGGRVLLFLDADCVPAPGWLAAHLAAHARGAVAAGGPLALPPGLPPAARCDYYASTYHLHPGRPAGPVPNHTPANVSVRRDVFLATSGFTEAFPVADGHEELAWQGELLRAGHRIVFVPEAVVRHYNRPRWGNLLRRSWRWGYSALESKAESGAGRAAWSWRHPRLRLALAFPLAPLETLYVVACWLRAGALEPVLYLPGILAARLAYAAGFVEGGRAWLRRRAASGAGAGGSGARPRWR